MTKFCYFNGEYIPQDEAVLPVTDISILRGYAVFDFAKVYNGHVFLLQEHLDRFKNSAQRLSLKIPLSNKQIEKVIMELLDRNLMKDANIRMVLTGGETVEGLSFNANQGNFFILTEDVKSLSEKYYSKGGKLMTYEHQRPVFDSKTTNYITAVQLQEEKHKKKAIEILYTFKGNVLECTTSNFFIIKKNILITPKDSILLGMTRNFVIQRAKEAGFKVQERKIKTSELRSAHEAFITATNKEILPIVQIDAKKVGKGRVGPITKKLMIMFNETINSLE